MCDSSRSSKGLPLESGTQQLIKMANQIGSFFEAQSRTDPAAAAKAVASHLKLFWAPSMRKRLIGELDGGQAADLDALPAEALRAHRDMLLSTVPAEPADKKEAFPEGGGDAG